MSYCRYYPGESDVYVIGTVRALECFGAGWELEAEKPVHDRIMVPDWATVEGKIVKQVTMHEAPDIFYTVSRSEMIAHLEQHVAAGHLVPDYAFERLRKDLAEVGNDYNQGGKQ